jgi:hypothetical protein
MKFQIMPVLKSVDFWLRLIFYVIFFAFIFYIA